MVGKEHSPNPLTCEDINNILNFLHKNLKDAPTWVKNPTNIPVSIGTSLSIFNQMRVLSGLDQFSARDVELMIETLIDRNDSELHDFETEMSNRHSHLIEGGYITKLENSHYIVPKLCLLQGVMRKCEFETLKFHQVNGNCAALLTN